MICIHKETRIHKKEVVIDKNMISTSESTIIQLEPSHNSKTHGTKHMAQIDLICITQSEASNQKFQRARRIKYYNLGKGVF